MFDLATMRRNDHREENKSALWLSLQDFVDDLERAVEVAKFRTIDRHEFVSPIGFVNLDRRFYRHVFPQAEDWIDAREMLLIKSLTVSG